MILYDPNITIAHNVAHIARLEGQRDAWLTVGQPVRANMVETQIEGFRRCDSRRHDYTQMMWCGVKRVDFINPEHLRMVKGSPV